MATSTSSLEQKRLQQNIGGTQKPPAGGSIATMMGDFPPDSPDNRRRDVGNAQKFAMSNKQHAGVTSPLDQLVEIWETMDRKAGRTTQYSQCPDRQ